MVPRLTAAQLMTSSHNAPNKSSAASARRIQQNMQTTVHFYTVAQAAQILRLSNKTIWHLINQDKLQTVRLSRKTVITDESLMDYLKERATACRQGRCYRHSCLARKQSINPIAFGILK
jgi:excisionase family DNA binding protein